jgi:signal transduction histidine kinase
MTFDVEVTDLVLARRRVEEALRTRDEFIAVAAHELRTPLTTLRLQVDLLPRRLARDGLVPSDGMSRFLDGLVAQTDRLARLVSQLLDVSGLEAGKLTVKAQPVDLHALVVDCIEIVQLKSAGRPITMAASSRPMVAGDAARLEQVLMNLLDNALKYSPADAPIEVTLATPGPGTVELAVHDHGPGIPTDQRAGIFERFYQVPGAAHQGGMGLGLYISRQIVELHGGKLEADFPASGGTRFVVRLPALGAAERGDMPSSQEPI